MNKYLGFVLIFALMLVSCSKEGNNGLATIEGYVQIDLYSDVNNALITSYMAQEEDVYIIYGDHEFYDDDVATSFDGKFAFRYLNQGDYTLFVYSECQFNTATCPSGNDVVQLDVAINSRKEVVNVDTIVINKFD